MCEICEMKPEERKAAQEFRIQQLKRFTNQIAAVRDGVITPHTEQAKDISVAARQLIHYLVEDWM